VQLDGWHLAKLKLPIFSEYQKLVLLLTSSKMHNLVVEKKQKCGKLIMGLLW
jgi:hypothetical protein